ncbi:FIST N-terminal domain-containing protein [Hydrogenimonas sp. SS33]|uniref:FIST N-terminal domain-containing protein n=1 Tax=Hydrogenimonas leucolamina TaxID=2954236 RepID=UPI00336C292D
MRQLGFEYRNRIDFESFVRREGLDRCRHLLLQVSCPNGSSEKMESLRRELHSALPHAVIVGGSSALQFSGTQIREEVTFLGITVFENSRISLFEQELGNVQKSDYDEIAKRLAERTNGETKGILLLSNTFVHDMEKLIVSINHYMAHIPVFGGIASDNEPYRHFKLFSQNRVFEEEGIVAVILEGEHLHISCNHFFDWEPIGREFTVTKASGRYIYELDGQPIIDIYSKYFGPLDEAKLLQLSLSHPLIRTSPLFGTVARALLEIDEEKGFFTGEFREGEKVQIGFGHYKRMTSRYEIIPEAYRQIPAEALWFYICISYQYGYIDILKASGQFYRESDKVFAFITFGEFTHRNDRNLFLNYSLTRVALTEDLSARAKINLIEVERDPKDELLATLSTLISASSKEITDLKRHLEREVEERTKELAELNASLERRIAMEVNKNREKDKILYHQSKLASMGEMINNIAHQWRQPLNIIALVMQDLALKAHMGNVAPPAVEHAEKKVHETLRYLSDTIDDFRSFTVDRPEYTHPGAFEVCKTVKEMVRLVSIVLEDEKIGLKLKLPEREALVKGNANDLKQVLLNLVYNAIDVFKERKVKDAKISIEVKYNREITIIVKDNGGGINPEIVDKIFEPYFTTKYKARGTGLGLYMSKMIVEKRLKGKIAARNHRSGAVFWIELPILS